MNETDRIASLPVDLPHHLRDELRKIYRYMLFKGRQASSVNGILAAVKDGQTDWMAVLYQQAVVRKDSLYPRCYWRVLAIGVPDVLVVAHTMKVFGDFEPDEQEQAVFAEIKEAFEFKLTLAGASERLSIQERILTVLQDVTTQQSQAEQGGRGMDFSFSYTRKLGA